MTELYRVEVEITAPVYDTEVTDRVVDTITNIFPNATVEEGHGELRATTHTLEQFSELLHRQEILDTARSVLFENRDGNATQFLIKKQAAFVGRVNFQVGEPDELGALAVRIRVDEPSFEEYVDYIAPRTEDGRPVE